MWFNWYKNVTEMKISIFYIEIINWNANIWIERRRLEVILCSNNIYLTVLNKLNNVLSAESEMIKFILVLLNFCEGYINFIFMYTFELCLFKG